MELIAFFILVMAVPVAVMVCLTPRRRAIAFVLGLVFTWDFLLLARFSGPLILELVALAGALVSLAALLVEVPAFAIRTLRKYRSGTGGGADA